MLCYFYLFIIIIMNYVVSNAILCACEIILEITMYHMMSPLLNNAFTMLYASISCWEKVN